MEVLSGREDFPCGAFQISNDEDLVVKESDTSKTERPSVRKPVTNGNHAHRTTVLVLISKKYRYH